MNPERWIRLQDVFHRAEALPSPERLRFLDDECAGDPELRRQVESLLAASGDSVLVAGSVRDLAAELASNVPRPGDRVGPYRIVSELGTGGMGSVYLAERADEDFEQRVALKIVRGVVASPSAVERFRSERRILAQLEHPNIARLIDGGTTERGAPYLAMEPVDGEPIDVYCDRRRLSIRERLELFATVCDAVQHAHRNLVVHRDLKPSNLLVTADGTPKLLDFGIAKLLDPELEGGGTTRRGELPMTPEYASPEQVRGEPVSVSSDVYSLGLLLFELLTGRRAQNVASRERREIERAVCEAPPTRPSIAVTRVRDAPWTDEAASPQEMAAARRITPRALRRRLQGDLDTIVLAALRKEPERRYGSAAALADDLRRHLAREPVRARGDDLGYRAGRFVRRHWAGLAAAGVALAALLAGTVALWIGLDRATEAERAAAREARAAEAVSAFLSETLAAADPREAEGEEPTVGALLDRSAERIDELDGEPGVQARLLTTMGEAYFALGRYERALELLDRAVELLEHPEDRSLERLIEAQNLRVPLLVQAGRLEEAAATAERAMELTTSLTAEQAFDRARALNALAVALVDAGDPARAREVNLEILALLEDDESAEATAARAVTLSMLGSVERQLGNLERSKEYLERGLAATTDRGDLRHQRSVLFRDLGLAHSEGGDHLEARRLLRRSLETAEAVYGEAHPNLLGSLLLLAKAEVALGELEAAESHVSRAREIAESSHGRDSPNYAMMLYYAAELPRARGDFDRAAELLDEAIDRGEASMGSDHPNLLRFRVLRGEVLVEAGRSGEALRALEPLSAAVRARLGADHELARSAQEALARARREASGS